MLFGGLFWLANFKMRTFDMCCSLNVLFWHYVKSILKTVNVEIEVLKK